VFVSIPFGIFFGAVIPMAAIGCAMVLWLMNLIHPLARWNLVVILLGLGIVVVALLWQGHQKYVQEADVSVVTRVLSFIGLVIFMSGVYLHGLDRQRAMSSRGSEE
jgi:hypothetical protein